MVLPFLYPIRLPSISLRDSEIANLVALIFDYTIIYTDDLTLILTKTDSLGGI